MKACLNRDKSSVFFTKPHPSAPNAAVRSMGSLVGSLLQLGVDLTTVTNADRLQHYSTSDHLLTRLVRRSIELASRYHEKGTHLSTGNNQARNACSSSFVSQTGVETYPPRQHYQRQYQILISTCLPSSSVDSINIHEQACLAKKLIGPPFRSSLSDRSENQVSLQLSTTVSFRRLRVGLSLMLD